MISLEALLVFLAAAGIIVTFALIVRHYLNQAAAREAAEDGESPSHH
jgi:hypothetical protein